MSKSYRTTITIPASLKARMDEIGEEVNWSAVAARAFEQKLAEIITMRGVKDMNDVVARLKASRARNDDGAMKRGRQAGESWARHRAEYEELERLDVWTSSTDGWVDELTPDEFGGSSPYHFLVKTIRGEDCSDPEVHEFWNSATGQEPRSGDLDRPSFFEGFVDGALAVWEQVKDQV